MAAQDGKASYQDVVVNTSSRFETGAKIPVVQADDTFELPEDRAKDLIPLLDKDPDFEVRIAIVEEFAALGNELKDDKETLAALRRRQSDPQVQVRQTAAQATPSPQQVEVLVDGFDRLTKLWQAAKSGLL